MFYRHGSGLEGAEALGQRRNCSIFRSKWVADNGRFTTGRGNFWLEICGGWEIVVFGLGEGGVGWGFSTGTVIIVKSTNSRYFGNVELMTGNVSIWFREDLMGRNFKWLLSEGELYGFLSFQWVFWVCYRVLRCFSLFVYVVVVYEFRWILRWRKL